MCGQVMLILLVTCAEIAIVLCYFQLCNEDHHWWWRSFLNSGAAGLYLFGYACAIRRLHMRHALHCASAGRALRAHVPTHAGSCARPAVQLRVLFHAA
jgi:hypothetical protein